MDFKRLVKQYCFECKQCDVVSYKPVVRWTSGKRCEYRVQGTQVRVHIQQQTLTQLPLVSHNTLWTVRFCLVSVFTVDISLSVYPRCPPPPPPLSLSLALLPPPPSLFRFPLSPPSVSLSLSPVLHALHLLFPRVLSFRVSFNRSNWIWEKDEEGQDKERQQVRWKADIELRE